MQTRLVPASLSDRFVHDFSRIPVNPRAAVQIQPKLVVGNPGDIHEADADHVAEQVLQITEPQLDGGYAGWSALTNSTAQPRQQASTMLRDTLHSGGQPLDATTRAYFEPRFGYDFSEIRIHTNARAAQSASAINAMAYTIGGEIVFGSGKYAPETNDGKRLLAHELAHIQQQRFLPVTNPSVIQRQPMSSELPSDAPTATNSGYEETKHAPSLRVRIIAHASPRWRGARDATDADRRNLELSWRRADAVRFAVTKLLADRFGSGTSVDIDTTIEDQDDTVGVKTEARGSHDTLKEAKGDRSDDAAQRRRVDVIIKSSQRTSGLAGVSRTLLTRPTASKFWHVSLDMSAGGSAGAAGSLLTLTLTNDLSGQSMQGKVWALGGGPKASLGASVSIWSDPTGFSTDRPVNFVDFDGAFVRYTNVGFNMFLGYEKAYLSFFGFGKDAVSIDVGGWNTGTVGVGGSVVAGKLSFNLPYPSTTIPITGTDTTVVPYERTDRGEDVHKVLFSTNRATLSDLEVDILDSFLASVVAPAR